MTRAALLACLAAGTLAAAPVPREDEAARLRRLYGEKVDSHKDSSFELVGDRLRITVPPRPGHQIIYNSLTAAARTAKDVRGDFTAVVRVALPVRELPAAEGNPDTPSGCAGLIAWAGDDEFVAIVREERYREGKQPQAIHDWHSVRGQGGGGGLIDPRPGRPALAFVRLKREGQTVRTAFGADGEGWVDWRTYTVGWPDTVKVGVMAENGSAAVWFEAVFDQYSLTLPKK